MSLSRAFGSGLIGACVLTIVHETVRRLVPNAPRMDILGKQALATLYREVGHEPPDDPELHYLALAGDVASNAAYYSLVGAGDAEGAGMRGALLGLGAGIGSVVLPKYLGLDEAASKRTPATAWMTVGLYVAGGLAAALAYRMFETESHQAHRVITAGTIS